MFPFMLALISKVGTISKKTKTKHAVGDVLLELLSEYLSGTGLDWKPAQKKYSVDSQSYRTAVSR